MMKKRLKTGLFVFLGILITTGIVLASMPARKLLSLFAPKIDHLRIVDARIDEKMVTMNVLANVKPSLLSGIVDSVAYALSLYGTQIAKGQKSFEKAEREGNPQVLKIPLTMNHNVTRELVRRQVKEGEKVQLHFQAFSDVPLFGRQRFVINEDLDLVIPTLPGAEVTHLSITDFGLDEMEMVITMHLDNPNQFDFYIREMKMTLNFPEKMTSVGGTVKDYLVKARSITPIQIAAVSDVKKPLKTAFKTLTGDHVWSYTMNSYMVLEPKSDVVGTVEMNTVKTGTINVVRQIKKLKEAKKAEKKAQKEQEKQAKGK